MRMIKVAAIIILSVGLANAGSSWAGEPERQILGVSLAMTADQAHARLKELGTLARTEPRPRQEVWVVKDQSFSHLLVGFGKEDKLLFITAVARTDQDAKKVTYEQAGDLKEARQAGDPKINNFRYEWEFPKEDAQPHTLVVAAGRDPHVLTTYSLKNLDVPMEEEKD